MTTDLLTVHKFVGTGNDFLFVNMLDGKTKKQVAALEKSMPRPVMAERLCRRNESVGADGLIFIEKAKGPQDFKWDFYNSDGSSAEACGNASRCAIRFARQILKLKKKMIRFSTLGGDIKGAMAGPDYAKVYLGSPRMQHESMEISNNDKFFVGSFVNTGVPHFVTEAKFKSHLELDWSTAFSIQTHKLFGSKLTNVTFIEILKKTKVRAVTFERGVVNFTKACGTGAIAAAYVLSEKNKTQEKITVEMPGGELTVSFDNSGRTCLEGAVHFLAVAKIFKESFA